MPTETEWKMNGKIILTVDSHCGTLLVCAFYKSPQQFWQNIVNVNGFSMCFGISKASSVRAEIEHVVLVSFN